MKSTLYGRATRTGFITVIKTGLRKKNRKGVINIITRAVLKRTIFKGVLITALTILTPNSFALEEAEHSEGGPCMRLMEACKSAGYIKSTLSEKKSLSKDCLQPLLNGKKIEGVVIEQKILDACKAKKAEIKSKK